MRLSLIVAMSSNRVIGINNQLPWRLPADLKHFKQLTLGKPIIMGRKTYESIGKPLPGRRNIVISHNPKLNIAGCDIATSMQAALTLVATEPEVMVIGGAQLFQAAIPYATHLYLTLIHKDFQGDCFLPPEVDDPLYWRLIERIDHYADAQNAYDYSFLSYARISNPLPGQ